jgi:hypothetical protein
VKREQYKGNRALAGRREGCVEREGRGERGKDGGDKEGRERGIVRRIEGRIERGNEGREI